MKPDNGDRRDLAPWLRYRGGLLITLFMLGIVALFAVFG